MDRDQLETKLLTLLMQKDAREWHKRIQATLGKEATDEPEEHRQTTKGPRHQNGKAQVAHR